MNSGLLLLTTSLARSAAWCQPGRSSGAFTLSPRFFICRVASSFCLRTSSRVFFEYSSAIFSSPWRTSWGIFSQVSLRTTVAPVKKPQGRLSMLPAREYTLVVYA